MIRLMILSACVLVVGCQGRITKDNATKVDSIKYPLLIDSGKKIIYERGGDTITFTNGELYQQDSFRHPLHQFYLTYPEWKTISCIIAVDERDYWDKAMIGLIEKAGNLRVSYKGQTLRLAPIMPVKMNEGKWTGTFKNDSLEIQISGLLENKRILRSLTGYGNIILRMPGQTINDTIYMVYKKK